MIPPSYRYYDTDTLKCDLIPIPILQKLLPQRLFADTPGLGDYTYASFVAFNKVYSTDVNKRVHCVRAGQFKTAPRHTRDDCKLGGWGLGSHA